MSINLRGNGLDPEVVGEDVADRAGDAAMPELADDVLVIRRVSMDDSLNREVDKVEADPGDCCGGGGFTLMTPAATVEPSGANKTAEPERGIDGVGDESDSSFCADSKFSRSD